MEDCRCGKPVHVKSRGVCMACYKRDWRRRTGRMNPRVVASEEDRREKERKRSRASYYADQEKAIKAAAASRDRRKAALTEKRKTPAHRERMRRNWLRKYGTTPEEVDKAQAEQRHCCAVCGLPLGQRGTKRMDEPVVDHCHATNKFRGVLHRACNSVLGLMKENTAAFLGAAAYLEKHK